MRPDSGLGVQAKVFKPWASIRTIKFLAARVGGRGGGAPRVNLGRVCPPPPFNRNISLQCSRIPLSGERYAATLGRYLSFKGGGGECRFTVFVVSGISGFRFPTLGCPDSSRARLASSTVQIAVSMTGFRVLGLPYKWPPV